MRTIQVVRLMYKITPSFVMRTGNPPLRFIIWLNHWAGKMKGIVRSQWLPEPILPARDFPGCFPKKIFVWVHKNAKMNLVDIHSSLIGNLSNDDGKRQCKRHCSDSDFIALIPNPNLSIGRFRVPKTLTFKMRLGAQPFLWKWVLFAWEWKMISISKAEHLPSFWNRGPGELGNGLLLGCHLFPSAKLTFSSQWFSQDISLFLHDIWLSLEISVHKSLSLFNF